MQTRSFRGSGEPAWVIASSNACFRLGPDPRRALGPAASRAASTGRTHDRTRPMLHQRKKALVNQAPSTHDPTVWTGRALQAESDDLEVIGLALLYPALERNVCVPGHHGYPRASDLILGKAQRGRLCHQITDATARPFLHLFIPARRPRRESQLLLSGSASDVGRRPSPFRLRPS